MGRFDDREYDDVCRNMVGKKYGQLLVLEYIGKQRTPEGDRNYRIIRARCDCGAEVIAPATKVRLGGIKRCRACSVHYKKKATLCWSCAKATNKYLCPWAGGKPRDDWDADQTVIDGMDTWQVNGCPGFKKG